MQFAVSFEFDQVHTKHENLLSVPLESEQTRQRIIAVHCNRGIYLSVYLYLIISK